MDCYFALGNDCSIAIAEHVAGNVEDFVELMNNRAKTLGLVNTHFTSPHGLDDDEHYTSAYDLAILTNYVLKIEKFREIVATKVKTIMVGDYPRTVKNTNELLGVIDGIYGVKTGFTGKAGRCLVSACKRENLDIIIVVLGADTKKIRGLDTKNIINYIYNNFEMVNTEEIIKSAFFDAKKKIKIKTFKTSESANFELEENFNYIYPINKNKIANLKTSVFLISSLEGKKEKGLKVRNVKLKK